MKKIISVLLVLCLGAILLSNSVFAATAGESENVTIIDEPQDLIGLAIEGTVILVFFCFLEWLVSIPFKMHEEYKKLIVLSSVLTQLAMYTLLIVYLLLLDYCGDAWLRYLPRVLGFVVFMPYIVKYLIYKEKMLGFTTKQILLYTFLGNTASTIIWLLIFINI